MIGRHVEISGLAGRPDLNGKTGRVESQNPNTQRYNVLVDGSGELVALREANLRAAGDARPPPQPAARAAPAAGAAFAMPAGGVPDPNLAALTCALVLVLVVGFSALNAALVSGVLYLALSAVRREGGARGAARAVAQRVAELSLRVGLTPAQFGFLLIAAAVLVWNLLLRGGSSSSYGGSSS